MTAASESFAGDTIPALMRSIAEWHPTKFVYRHDRLVASRNPSDCQVGSRLAADLVARLYQMHIPQFASGRLLDLGCGSVPLFECYRPYVTENICVDWYNTRDWNPHLDCALDLGVPLPFQDNQFRTIILSDVLEHLPEPFRLWDEMARVLEPKGHILMNVPFLYWIHEAPYDYYRYTEYALRRFASGSGFSIVVLKIIGGLPEIATDVLSKYLQRVPVVGEAAAAAVQKLTFLAFSRGPLRRASEATGRRFPLGYFLVAENNG